MHHWVSAAFTLLFCLVFGASYFVWTKLFHGTEKHKLVPEFSSYLMAGLHGLSICSVALWLLHSHEDWTDFDAPNTHEQNIALCLSLGYFIAVSKAQNKIILAVDSTATTRPSHVLLPPPKPESMRPQKSLRAAVSS